jgi:hypothetical protein
MWSAGGVKDIAISGNRFALIDGNGVLHVKDGPDSTWPSAVNNCCATKVVLTGNWIGWIESGAFQAKNGILDTWKTIAPGGGVTDIAIGPGEWFAFIGSGTFYAKQGVSSPDWLLMAPNAKNIAINTG